MSPVLLGAIAMASFVAALFFLRFWRQTHDRLFLLFSAAFAVDCATRIALSLPIRVPSEHEPLFYLGRLVTFLLIAIAIADKTRKSKAEPEATAKRAKPAGSKI